MGEAWDKTQWATNGQMGQPQQAARYVMHSCTKFGGLSPARRGTSKQIKPNIALLFEYTIILYYIIKAQQPIP